MNPTNNLTDMWLNETTPMRFDPLLAPSSRVSSTTALGGDTTTSSSGKTGSAAVAQFNNNSAGLGSFIVTSDAPRKGSPRKQPQEGIRTNHLPPPQPITEEELRLRGFVPTMPANPNPYAFPPQAVMPYPMAAGVYPYPFHNPYYPSPLHMPPMYPPPPLPVYPTYPPMGLHPGIPLAPAAPVAPTKLQQSFDTVIHRADDRRRRRPHSHSGSSSSSDGNRVAHRHKTALSSKRTHSSTVSRKKASGRGYDSKSDYNIFRTTDDEAEVSDSTAAASEIVRSSVEFVFASENQRESSKFASANQPTQLPPFTVNQNVKKGPPEGMLSAAVAFEKSLEGLVRANYTAPNETLIDRISQESAKRHSMGPTAAGNGAIASFVYIPNSDSQYYCFTCALMCPGLTGIKQHNEGRGHKKHLFNQIEEVRLGLGAQMTETDTDRPQATTAGHRPATPRCVKADITAQNNQAVAKPPSHFGVLPPSASPQALRTDLSSVSVLWLVNEVTFQFECPACGVTVSGNAVEHCGGERHKKRVSALLDAMLSPVQHTPVVTATPISFSQSASANPLPTYVPPPNYVPAPINPINSQPIAARDLTDDYLKSLKGKLPSGASYDEVSMDSTSVTVLHIIPKMQGQYYCPACDSTVSGNMAEHCNGQKHNKNVRLMLQELRNKQPPAAVTQRAVTLLPPYSVSNSPVLDTAATTQPQRQSVTAPSFGVFPSPITVAQFIEASGKLPTHASLDDLVGDQSLVTVLFDILNSNGQRFCPACQTSVSGNASEHCNGGRHKKQVLKMITIIRSAQGIHTQQTPYTAKAAEQPALTVTASVPQLGFNTSMAHTIASTSAAMTTSSYKVGTLPAGVSRAEVLANLSTTAVLFSINPATRLYTCPACDAQLSGNEATHCMGMKHQKKLKTMLSTLSDEPTHERPSTALSNLKPAKVEGQPLDQLFEVAKGHADSYSHYTAHALELLCSPSFNVGMLTALLQQSPVPTSSAISLWMAAGMTKMAMGTSGLPRPVGSSIAMLEVEERFRHGFRTMKSVLALSELIGTVLFDNSSPYLKSVNTFVSASTKQSTVSNNEAAAAATPFKLLLTSKTFLAVLPDLLDLNSSAFNGALGLEPTTRAMQSDIGFEPTLVNPFSFAVIESLCREEDIVTEVRRQLSEFQDQSQRATSSYGDLVTQNRKKFIDALYGTLLTFSLGESTTSTRDFSEASSSAPFQVSDTTLGCIALPFDILPDPRLHVTSKEDFEGRFKPVQKNFAAVDGRGIESIVNRTPLGLDAFACVACGGVLQGTKARNDHSANVKHARMCAATFLAQAVSTFIQLKSAIKATLSELQQQMGPGGESSQQAIPNQPFSFSIQTLFSDTNSLKDVEQATRTIAIVCKVLLETPATESAGPPTINQPPSERSPSAPFYLQPNSLLETLATVCTGLRARLISATPTPTTATAIPSREVVKSTSSPVSQVAASTSPTQVAKSLLPPRDFIRTNAVEEYLFADLTNKHNNHRPIMYTLEMRQSIKSALPKALSEGKYANPHAKLWLGQFSSGVRLREAVVGVLGTLTDAQASAKDNLPPYAQYMLSLIARIAKEVGVEGSLANLFSPTNTVPTATASNSEFALLLLSAAASTNPNFTIAANPFMLTVLKMQFHALQIDDTADDALQITDDIRCHKYLLFQTLAMLLGPVPPIVLAAAPQYLQSFTANGYPYDGKSPCVCLVCGASLTAAATLNDHVSSEKHKKRALALLLHQATVAHMVITRLVGDIIESKDISPERQTEEVAKHIGQLLALQVPLTDVPGPTDSPFEWFTENDYIVAVTAILMQSAKASSSNELANALAIVSSDVTTRYSVVKSRYLPGGLSPGVAFEADSVAAASANAYFSAIAAQLQTIHHNIETPQLAVFDASPLLPSLMDSLRGLASVSGAILNPSALKKESKSLSTVIRASSTMAPEIEPMPSIPPFLLSSPVPQARSAYPSWLLEDATAYNEGIWELLGKKDNLTATQDAEASSASAQGQDFPSIGFVTTLHLRLLRDNEFRKLTIPPGKQPSLLEGEVRDETVPSVPYFWIQADIRQHARGLSDQLSRLVEGKNWSQLRMEEVVGLIMDVRGLAGVSLKEEESRPVPADIVTLSNVCHGTFDALCKALQAAKETTTGTTSVAYTRVCASAVTVLAESGSSTYSLEGHLAATIAKDDATPEQLAERLREPAHIDLLTERANYPALTNTDGEADLYQFGVSRCDSSDNLCSSKKLEQYDLDALHVLLVNSDRFIIREATAVNQHTMADAVSAVTSKSPKNKILPTIGANTLDDPTQLIVDSMIFADQNHKKGGSVTKGAIAGRFAIGQDAVNMDEESNPLDLASKFNSLLSSAGTLLWACIEDVTYYKSQQARLDSYRASLDSLVITTSPTLAVAQPTTTNVAILQEDRKAKIAAIVDSVLPKRGGTLLWLVGCCSESLISTSVMPSNRAKESLSRYLVLASLSLAGRHAVSLPELCSCAAAGNSPANNLLFPPKIAAVLVCGASLCDNASTTAGEDVAGAQEGDPMIIPSIPAPPLVHERRQVHMPVGLAPFYCYPLTVEALNETPIGTPTIRRSPIGSRAHSRGQSPTGTAPQSTILPQRRSRSSTPVGMQLPVKSPRSRSTPRDATSPITPRMDAPVPAAPAFYFGASLSDAKQPIQLQRLSTTFASEAFYSAADLLTKWRQRQQAAADSLKARPSPHHLLKSDELLLLDLDTLLIEGFHARFIEGDLSPLGVTSLHQHDVEALSNESESIDSRILKIARSSKSSASELGLGELPTPKMRKVASSANKTLYMCPIKLATKPPAPPSTKPAQPVSPLPQLPPLSGPKKEPSSVAPHVVKYMDLTERKRLTVSFRVTVIAVGGAGGGAGNGKHIAACESDDEPDLGLNDVVLTRTEWAQLVGQQRSAVIDTTLVSICAPERFAFRAQHHPSLEDPVALLREPLALSTPLREDDADGSAPSSAPQSYAGSVAGDDDAAEAEIVALTLRTKERQAQKDEVANALWNEALASLSYDGQCGMHIAHATESFHQEPNRPLALPTLRKPVSRPAVKVSLPERLQVSVSFVDGNSITIPRILMPRQPGDHVRFIDPNRVMEGRVSNSERKTSVTVPLPAPQLTPDGFESKFSFEGLRVSVELKLAWVGTEDEVSVIDDALKRCGEKEAAQDGFSDEDEIFEVITMSNFRRESEPPKKTKTALSAGPQPTTSVVRLFNSEDRDAFAKSSLTDVLPTVGAGSEAAALKELRHSADKSNNLDSIPRFHATDDSYTLTLKPKHPSTACPTVMNDMLDLVYSQEVPYTELAPLCGLKDAAKGKFDFSKTVASTQGFLTMPVVLSRINEATWKSTQVLQRYGGPLMTIGQQSHEPTRASDGGATPLHTVARLVATLKAPSRALPTCGPSEPFQWLPSIQSLLLKDSSAKPSPTADGTGAERPVIPTFVSDAPILGTVWRLEL